MKKKLNQEQRQEGRKYTYILHSLSSIVAALQCLAYINAIGIRDVEKDEKIENTDNSTFLSLPLPMLTSVGRHIGNDIYVDGVKYKVKD